ncbi:folylpolyglutamate synthase/dihydrofolate synthase family protein [soil metagenome]
MILNELLPWLFARTTGGIRWGLERTEELLAGVDHPHRHFRAIHIGGTNGKGSVASLCDAALRASGSAGRIGLYTSPHLARFGERIRVDGVPLSDEIIASAARRLCPAIERTGASFFEATTAIAFLCFRECGVDTAVVEVGLGGRLDATNVVHPVVCAITNVSLDHTDYLGEQIEQIASEKAGILKRGVPALTAASGEALSVLREAAADRGAPLHELCDRVAILASQTRYRQTLVEFRSEHWGEASLDLPLPGMHQASNATLAAELLALLPPDLRPDWQSIRAGFESVSWPGRLQVEQRMGTTWIFDVAHNPAGADVLADSLAALELPPPLVLVVSILADKNWQEMLPRLVDQSDAVILTVSNTAPASRSWNPQEVAQWLAQRGGSPATRIVPSLAAAVKRAATLAPHGSVLVTGSFHTVGEALVELGFPTC